MWLRGGFQAGPIIFSRIDAALSMRRVFLTRTVEDNPGRYLDYSFPYWPLLITVMLPFSTWVTYNTCSKFKKVSFRASQKYENILFQ